MKRIVYNRFSQINLQLYEYNVHVQVPIPGPNAPYLPAAQRTIVPCPASPDEPVFCSYFHSRLITGQLFYLLVPVFYGLIPTNTYTYLPEIAASTSPIILMYSHSWFIR